VDADESGVIALIEQANAARRAGDAGARLRPDAGEAEARLEALFGCGERLAVYGSLAPGRENHYVVEPLGGAWSEGVVEGDLTRYGWGSAIGYRALRVRPGAPGVSVRVLSSAALRTAWPRLDEFEGSEYRRVLVPVWSQGATDDRTLLTVANLYEGAL
jgi:gamma-glutamylcyclotransferase (GGCT)/AIG2-like uncharacterized protein YtfP